MNKTNKTSITLFITLMTCFSITLIVWRLVTIDISQMNGLLVIWLLVFSFLIINIAHMFTCGVLVLFLKPKKLKERFLVSIPRTAIVYTIRSESFGLFERIDFTSDNNNHQNIDIWILSGASPKPFKQYEKNVVKRLKEKYGTKLHYRECFDAGKNKSEMLNEWLHTHGSKYRYFTICDADSMLPRDFILKMVRKAEHRDNQDIAIFQSAITTKNTKTFYSQFIGIATEIGQKLYDTTKQLIFKRSLFWGHNALIRANYFKKISIPKKVMSHDIWETVYLDEQGYRTVYCHDVLSYEDAPANYLEDKKRMTRWIRGNFETIPLIFKKNISLANRFYVSFGIYMYITNILFLLWIFSGVVLEKTAVWSAIGHSHHLLTGVILMVIFVHKLAICKTSKYLLKIIYEILLSTIISMNSIFYLSMIILSLPFQKKQRWRPMAKNPFEELTLAKTVSQMWPGTLVGIISAMLAINYAPTWGLYSAPILISLIISIPVIYFSSKLRLSRIS